MADTSAHERYPLLDLCTPVPPQRPPKPRWARPKDRSKGDSDSRRSIGESSSSSGNIPTPPPRKPLNERVNHWTVTGPGTVTLQVHTPSGTEVTLTVYL
ncbi:putative E4 protein [Human papillomavirus 125]|uniref:Putative E4 protein n=1 Tax=Human papillomavirus 125 TaxID=673323 RepID=C7U319_9PAPI|nr:putative E4 protein [Human papillomavirus 125]